MKNKLIDLNNHLFAQLERLSDEDTKGEALAEEIERSKAVGSIASQIINNARLSLDAHKAFENFTRRLPPMIGSPEEYDEK